MWNSFRCFTHSHFKLCARVTNFFSSVTLLPVSTYLSATSSDMFGHLLFRSFLRLCVFLWISTIGKFCYPHQFHFRSFQPRSPYTTSFVHCAACCLDTLFPQECFSSPFKDRYLFHLILANRLCLWMSLQLGLKIWHFVLIFISSAFFGTVWS